MRLSPFPADIRYALLRAEKKNQGKSTSRCSCRAQDATRRRLRACGHFARRLGVSLLRAVREVRLAAEFRAVPGQRLVSVELQRRRCVDRAADFLRGARM